MIEESVSSEIPINRPIQEFPKKRSILVPYLLSLVLVAMLSGVGVYLWQRSIVKDQSKLLSQTPAIVVVPTEVSVQKITPTITSEVTTNWKKYVYDGLNLSFLYPSNYRLDTTLTERVRLLGEDYKEDCSDFGCAQKGSLYDISKANNCQLNDIVGDKKLLESGGSNESFKIYNISGYEGSNYRSALVRGGSNCVEINCLSNDLCQGKMYEEFKKIVLSVKFLNTK